MKEETDIKAIRDTTMALFDAVPIVEVKELEGMGFVQHPFISSMFGMNMAGETISFLDPENVKESRKMYKKMIYAGSATGIYIMIQNPYKMTWFNLCADYFSDEDYGKYLRDSWCLQENPNQDKNVPRRKAVSLFRKAKKKYLMSEKEYEYYEALPDKMTVWRGVSPGRERMGLSWTDDKSVAAWFKQRFETEEKKGYVLEAEIDKKNILAYFNVRNEKEIVVDVFKIKKQIREI